MNRIDRLFGILLLLQRQQVIRAEDIAHKFEVSPRTIYRDIAALSEMGVPVVSLLGEGYQLGEGYYLPPLIFTPAEASALFLGARMLALQAAGQLPRDAEMALNKLAQILPAPTRAQIEKLTQIIQFMLPEQRFNLEDPRLEVLLEAIHERRVIWLRYHSYSRDEISEREVEPHTLSYYNGSWYINGYCRLRQDRRGFRLERIESLKLLRQTFSPRQSHPDDAPQITVRVRFDAQIVRWVRERQHYSYQAEEPVAGSDDRIMLYRVHDTRELKSWLLGWGAVAEILEPAELRAAIRAEALKLAQRLT